MTEAEKNEKAWEAKIAEALVGRTITAVEYLSLSEADEAYWQQRPISIQLDNKICITPTSDDEGNDGGAIHTNMKNLSIIPVMGV